MNQCDSVAVHLSPWRKKMFLPVMYSSWTPVGAIESIADGHIYPGNCSMDLVDYDNISRMYSNLAKFMKNVLLLTDLL